MTYLQSIILGVVQGASEFLPVSSSGHLVVARNLMEMEEIPLLFDILLHLPTLLAIVIVFRKRIGALFSVVYRLLRGRKDPGDQENLRLVRTILIATAATAVVGYAFSRLQDQLPISARLVGALFLLTAALLLSTRFFRGKKSYSDLTLGDALITGAAQGFGVLPGISRSGATLTAGLACGADRGKAGEYAFLLAIPAILGAFALKIGDIGEMAVDAGVLTVGMLCSFVVGLASLLLLLRIIRRGRLYLFVLYLVPVGIATIVLL